MSYLLISNQDRVLATGGGFINANTPFYSPQRMSRKGAFKLRARMQDENPMLDLRVVDEAVVYRSRR